jgi:amidase
MTPGCDEAIADLDALGQAELVRAGEISAGELLDVFERRLELLNPRLNAVITPMLDVARARTAGPLDGVFAGVPFLVKDIFAAHAGVRQTHGSRSMRNHVPDADSELVKRHKDAGLVIAGKTNSPEFGVSCTTEPLAWGPTRNPWDLTRSPGGSSGGSAAAVAARLVPMAHANDGGGSIRVPASACGVFGLKPSRSRNPLRPHTSDLIIPIVSEHAVTRSVRDSAALLDATSRADRHAAYRAPAAPRPFLAETTLEPGRLRIGFTSVPPIDVPVAADCREAVQDAARLCESLGHAVVERAPEVDGERLRAALGVFWSVLAASSVNAARQLARGALEPDDIEPTTWRLAEVGNGHSAPAYLDALTAIQEILDTYNAFFDDCDVLLTPTVAEPPPPLGSFDFDPQRPDRHLGRLWEHCPFTPLVNMAGQPAMSVPLHWNADGLPIGAHFVAPLGEEGLLLRLAAQLEAARPWSSRRPPVLDPLADTD